MTAGLAASRAREVAGRAREVATGLAAGVGAAAVVAGYPLWMQFFGPLRQGSSPFTPDFSKNDLAGFVRPSSFQLLHTAGSARFATTFQGGMPEYLAYLGWPVLAALAGVTVCFWRLPRVRAAAVAPLVPAPLPVAKAASGPGGWSTAPAALRLPDGAHVLAVPIRARLASHPGRRVTLRRTGRMVAATGR